ncbi:hypothetical protein UCDDA912_g00167 [Diaporthe ampelina]|uniref:Uncharacterized protein n=1 Tax=Diaporthe ampelina TaxID=1214573 RepID=A0A0G2G0I9_9PEZI|nr:hypothetical protein UCDDA912_g00167 [Diaporthe ampelina]
MTAYGCKFDLCAWSFQDWAMTNALLVNGTTAQSSVIADGKVPTFASHGPEGVNFSLFYTVTDPDFLRNDTSEINPIDQTAMELTLSTIWYSGEGSNGVPCFWNSAYLAGPNITETLRSMVTGITYNMMSGTSSTLSRGSLLETETFMKVRWEWLSLSVITVAGSIALLGVTI